VTGQGLISVPRRHLPVLQSHHRNSPQTGKPERRVTIRMSAKDKKALNAVIMQIALINIVFSFDSILTAVGLTKELSIMIIAVVASVRRDDGVSGPVSGL
jgi:predicted tellurium resistance membrane protein TerC